MNLSGRLKAVGFTTLCTLAGCALAGCAGGGGGSAPAPGSSIQAGPPAAPPPVARSLTSQTVEKTDITGPATLSGDYDGIGLRREKASGDRFTRTFIDRESALRIRVDADTDTYTVVLDVPGLGTGAVFDLDGHDFGFSAVQTNRYSDGTTERGEWTADYIEGVETGKTPADPSGATREPVLALNSRLATRYVSLGELLQRDLAWKNDDQFWNLDELLCDECQGLFSAEGERGRVLFAYGPRTPAASIPLTGTATWRVARTHLNGWRSNVNGGDYGFLYETPSQHAVDKLQLTADFGRQRIAARIDIPAERREVRDNAGVLLRTEYWAGADIRGEAGFTTAGRFVIPLSGSYSTLWPTAPAPSAPVQGRLDGAFFGPAVEEVGGALFLETVDHAYQVEGTFAATRP